MCEECLYTIWFGPGQIHNDDLFSVFSVGISMSAHVLASICYSLSICRTVNLFVTFMTTFRIFVYCDGVLKHLFLSIRSHTMLTRRLYASTIDSFDRYRLYCLHEPEPRCNATSDYGVNFFIIAFSVPKMFHCIG